MKKSSFVIKMLLSAAIFIPATFITSNNLQAQSKQLDSTVFETWRTCETLTIADDASWNIAAYKSKKEGSILVVKIDKLRFKKEIKGEKDVEMIDGQRSAIFFVKDTLYCINGTNGKIDTLGFTKSAVVDKKSPFITYMKGKTLYLKNSSDGRTDSLQQVKARIFATPEMLIAITRQNGISTITALNLKGKKGIENNILYTGDLYIDGISSGKSGKSLVFFSDKDSLFKNPRISALDIKTKSLTNFNIEQSMLPKNRIFNIKKGVEFSPDESYFKFEIALVTDSVAKPKGKVAKPAFEYELWRWNDTLIPLKQKKGPTQFEKSLKCVYHPQTNKFIVLSTGKGVFMQVEDESPYGFEFDETPYRMTADWEDPTPRDYWCTDIKTGERKMALRKFKGGFAISPRTPHMFIFDPDAAAWFILDIKSGEKVCISDLLPYPVINEEFDQPQPAGNYGQAGLSNDNQYFIVYDKYDVWALPTSGIGEPISVTNGYGRKNNIRLKVLKLEEKGEKKIGINLKEDIILESTNLDNMHTGFYKVSVGKDPVKLLEDACKLSFNRKLGKKYYIVKRERFEEAPDFWLTDKNFRLLMRLTDLNEQTKNFAIGTSEVIKWKDSAGVEQKGVLYTPEGYDSTKRYPVIVYFYETMTQDAFKFYVPEPTESTINPTMFVSRGYVVFMPDIHYEIGWPGRSCVNAVVSGTEHIINKGIADPERIGVQGHSWGGYQVAYLITQSDIFKCACSEAAVTNMTSAYTGIRSAAGTPRMFMYECTQSRIGGSLWEKQENYIKNSATFYLDQVTTPLLSRHCDADEAVPYSQGLELFLGLKRLGKQVWMFNYKGVGHNIRPWEVKMDWSRRMDEYFDYYLMDKQKPSWMK